ncbi:GBS Bsp-like repeat-containing protein [Christensenellaceae bacterium OttesenSCG-928-K19]|nr:GBS Bsp-like repeat-containing protein [Christensenellaceae bacterium OttesenSCG-928-K19]
MSKTVNPLKILLALLLIAAIVTGILPIIPQSTAQAANGKIVVIDPGHGMDDIGCTGIGGKTEASVNAGLAYNTAKKLQAKGYTVYLTHKVDKWISGATDIPVLLTYYSSKYDFETELAPTANSLAPDLYISIHNNSYTSSSAKGTEVYYTSRQNSTYLPRSKDLASIMLNQLTSLGFTSNRGVKDFVDSTGRDGPIRHMLCPAVVLECGFLTNQSDYNYITSATGTNNIATKIATGVDDFIAKYPQKIQHDQIPPTISGDIELGTTDPTQAMQFAVSASGVTDSGSGISTVEFHVWPQATGWGNSKKIIFSAAQVSGTNNWAAYIDLNRFDNGLYPYVIELHAMDVAGNKAKLGSTIINRAAADSTISASGLSFGATNPCYADGMAVVVSGVSAARGIQNVEVVAYNPASRRSTTALYTASNAGNGNWAVYFNIANHNNVYGYYNFDVYVKDTTGSRVKVLTTKTIAIAKDTTGPTASKLVFGAANPTTENAFAVQVQGVSDPSGVASVSFKIWHESDGAGKAVTVNGANAGNDTWAAYFSTSAFAGRTGTYVFQAIGVDGKGNRSVMKQSSIRIATDTVPPTISSVSLGASSPTYANGFAMVAQASDNIGIDYVQFAVWKASDGYATRKIYRAADVGKGSWAAYYPITGSGDYKVRAWVVDAAGNTTASSDVPITIGHDAAPPTVGSISFGTTSPTEAEGFAVVASNVQDSLSGVKSVSLEIYRQADGAASKKVIPMSKSSNNNWASYFNIATCGGKHGTYIFNVVTTDNRGNTGVAKHGSVVVNQDKTGPQIGDISFGTNSPTVAQGFAVVANNISDINGLSSVKIEVWNNAAGAANKKVYTATSSNGRDYAIYFTMSQFGYAKGNYTFKVIATDGKGNTSSKASVLNVGSVEGLPTSNGISLGASSPTTSTAMALSVTNIQSAAGIQKVEIAAWSNNNGQDDLTWYKCSQSGQNNWSTYFNTAAHGYDTGIYLFEAYVTDRNGLKVCVAQNRIAIQHTPATSSGISLGAANPTKETAFAVVANKVTSPYGLKSVSAKIWAENLGAAYAKTYTMAPDGKGNYSLFYTTSQQDYACGKYYIEVYTTDGLNRQDKVASTTITVDKNTSLTNMVALSIGAVNPAKTNGFAMVATNVTSPVGVKNVQFKVWPSSAPAAAYTYNATHNGKGNWAAYLSVGNHGNQYGEYVIQAIGIDQKGVSNIMGVERITLINPSYHDILGTSDATRAQMINYFKSKATFPSFYGMTLEQFVDIYIQEAAAEGIKADIAFAQMIHETNFLKYTGDVKIEQFNFAGIGATGGVHGNSFPDVRTGVRAQIQHLHAYASTASLNNPCVDPRYDIVVKAYGHGCAPTIEMLSEKWATGATYGNKIVEFLNAILASGTTATSAAYNAAILTDPEENILDAAATEEIAEPEKEAPPEIVDTPEDEPVGDSTNEASEPDNSNIMGESAVSEQQVVDYLLQIWQSQNDADRIHELYGISTQEFVAQYWAEAAAEGVKPEVAFADMLLSTNGLQFNGVVQPQMYNFDSSADEHSNLISYPDLSTGIRAHVQRLKCLSSRLDCNNEIVDQLWSPEARGTAPSLETLAISRGKNTAYAGMWLEKITELATFEKTADTNTTEPVPPETEVEVEAATPPPSLDHNQEAGLPTVPSGDQTK